jgi:hypothetical protein
MQHAPVSHGCVVSILFQPQEIQTHYLLCGRVLLPINHLIPYNLWCNILCIIYVSSTVQQMVLLIILVVAGSGIMYSTILPAWGLYLIILSPQRLI